MSKRDNPYPGTPNAQKKSPPKKRGVAHVIRRDSAKYSTPDLSSTNSEKTATKAPVMAAPPRATPPKGRGKAHVIRRNAPSNDFGGESTDADDEPTNQGLAESHEVLASLNPASVRPELAEEDEATRVAGAMGKLPGMAPIPLAGGADEYTVEERRPSPPQALVAMVEKDSLAVAPPDDPERGFFVVQQGSDRGRRVGLIEGRTSIGRGLDNDVVLTDIAVSRRHMYIERRDRVYFVCDLSSGNGVLINGSLKRGEVLIVDGDTFQIGNSVVAFEGPQARDEATGDWAPRGKNANLNDEDSGDCTVAGKGLVRNSQGSDEEALTQMRTNIADGHVEGEPEPESPPTHLGDPIPRPANIELASDIHELLNEQLETRVAQSKKDEAEAAALAAVSSIATPEPTLTPEPDIISMHTAPPLEEDDFPSMAGVGSTPVPAIPYPAQTAPVPKPLFSTNQPQPARQPLQGGPMPVPVPGPAPGPMPGPPLAHQNPGYGHLPGMTPNPMPTGAQAPHPSYGPGGSQPGLAPNPNMSMNNMSMTGAPLSRSMTQAPMTHSGYANGGYANAERGKPLAQRGRLLIGLISVAMLLIAIAIVVPLWMSRNKRKEMASKPKTSEQLLVSKTESDAIQPIDPQSDSTTGDSQNGTPKTSTQPTKVEEPGPTQIAALIAGQTTLPTSTWGNDETFLLEDPSADPSLPLATDAGTEQTGSVEELDAGAAASTATVPTKNVAKNNTPRNTKKPQTRKPQVRNPPKAKTNNAGLIGSGKALYKQRKFSSAADKFEQAADRADDDIESEDLFDRAKAVRDVGKLLADAEDDEVGNPVSAMNAYSKALSKDKRVGGGVHAQYIRGKLAAISPKAARSLMAKNKLVEAKKAADRAARYGESEAVEGIYRSLTRKAEHLLKDGKSAARDDDESKARKLFIQARKIAPKDSDVYEEAADELKDL